MSEYKVGCSPITNTIFAGRVKNEMWQGKKHDVTDTAVSAVAQHLLKANQALVFTAQDGKEYVMKVGLKK